MTLRLRPVALAALTALPALHLPDAHAALVSPGPSADAPSFDCSTTPTDGGLVSWPNGVYVATPEIAFDFFDGPDVASALDCNEGGFSETVVARKAGEGQKDFLKITLKEVLAASLEPDTISAIDTHIKFVRTEVLGEVVDEVEHWDNIWDVFGSYRVVDEKGNVTQRSLNFIGFKFTTAGRFIGLDDVSIKYSFNPELREGTLSFLAPLQDAEGRFGLTAAPSAVPEPGTLALLGTGLLGMAALRRRRW